MISLLQRRQASKAAVRQQGPLSGTTGKSGCCLGGHGLGWGLGAQVATTHTHTFSGAAEEPGNPWMMLHPRQAGVPQQWADSLCLTLLAVAYLPFPVEEADLASAAFWGTTGSDVGHHGHHGCAQLCPEGKWAGEVKGAGQMLLQLLCRGDRWDKRCWVLQGPVN